MTNAYTMQKQQQIAVGQTILEQLGGNRFKVMVGAKDALIIDRDLGGLRVKFRGCARWNGIEVTLDARDTYTVRFFKQAGPKRLWEVVEEQVFEGVYADDLQSLFTAETGLDTRL
jgi:hypothetical protein